MDGCRAEYAKVDSADNTAKLGNRGHVAAFFSSRGAAFQSATPTSTVTDTAVPANMLWCGPS